MHGQQNIKKCHSQFDFYFLSFLSAGTTSTSSKNFVIPFVVKKGVLGCSSEKFRVDPVNHVRFE